MHGTWKVKFEQVRTLNVTSSIDRMKILHCIASELLAESKASASNEKSTARDLLSLLVRSNLATDRPENQRLSDDDVIARTFFYLLVIATNLMDYFI